MCGRYQSWIEDDELVAIIEREKRGNAARYLHRNEVFPGEEMPVLYGSSFCIRARIVRWGYPVAALQEESVLQEKPQQMTLAGALSDNPGTMDSPIPSKGKLLINGRAETVMEKRLFREDIWQRRVALPTSGYYEWSQEKQKYHIGSGLVYLAAITHIFGETEHAVILTTEPVPSVQAIHHRMPLILEQHELERWLYDDHFCTHKLREGNHCQPSVLAIS